MNWHFLLKVPSCKLYDNKHMIALTQITRTEVLTLILVQFLS